MSFAGADNDFGEKDSYTSRVSLGSGRATEGENLKLVARRRKWSLEVPSPHPQLTFKALFTGCAVGVVCSFLALYYGLKTGIVPSLNILSGLGGFVFLKSMLKIGVFKGVFTPQENAVAQTAAVAVYAASSPGFGFTSAYLAMLNGSYEAVGKIEGNNPEDVIESLWWKEFLWCIGLGFFGFFVAFPLREYCVLKQRLVFPSGTATAYVIKSMHASAAKAKASFAVLAKFFSISFCVNLVTWAFNGLASFPIFGMRAAHYGWVMDFDLGSFGIGFILSNKVNASIFCGGLISYALLEPALDNNVAGPIDEGGWYDPENLTSDYLDASAYSLFGGLGIMIVQGAVSIGMLLWVLYSDFRAKGKGKGKGSQVSIKNEDPEVIDDDADERQMILDRIFLESEVPVWFPIVGYAVFGAVCILIMTFLFDTPWYQILVALFIIPLFAISNIQGMGRTDWDVASSYGKLIMFPFGAWNSKGSIIPALTTAVVTISGCSNSATLMQDFKTGYLLGSSPTKMFVAQMIGQFFGCIVTPSLFQLLTNAYEIPTDDPQAFITGIYGPIYRTLAIVATGGGFSSLPTNTLQITAGFIGLAILLDLAEILGPMAGLESYVNWLPDPTAIAIGMLVGAGSPFKFFLGGMIKAYWELFEPEIARDRSPYIASGLIAGSGIAVVLQSVMSLSGLVHPIDVDWSVNPLADMTAGLWVAAFFFAAITIGVAACGLLYWFPPAVVDDDESISPINRVSVHSRKSSVKTDKHDYVARMESNNTISESTT